MSTNDVCSFSFILQESIDLADCSVESYYFEAFVVLFDLNDIKRR